MARKKTKRSRKPSGIATIESANRKLQSMLIDPNIWGYMRSGMFKGVREKLLKIDYTTMRNVVDRVALVGAIINTRVDQVKKFGKYMPEGDKPGYRFIYRDRSKTVSNKDDKIFNQFADFIDQTGLDYDPDREDDFSDYLDMFVRETLTIDQVATEIQRNMKNEPIAFWILDGATIKRVDAKEFEGDRGLNAMKVNPNTKYLQMIEGLITNTYTSEDLLFDYKNKRADIRFRGFGYSAVEQSIDMITTLLFGYNYAKDQLMRDRVPKGFIQVMGDVGRPQLDAIREYWYSAMSGAGGQWNIPIVPSGKDGVGIDWKNIQGSNKDLEYHKLMMFVSSIISAVFGMDMAEMGLKADDSAGLLGESSEPRIQSSKDRGLGALLAHIEQHMNKIMRKVNDEYKFEFVGLESEDPIKLADLRKKDVETYKTVNEIREADGLEPIEDDYANVVLNVQAVQIYQGDKQQEAGGDEEGDYGDEGMGEEDQPDQSDEQVSGEEQEGSDVDWESLFKSMSEDTKKHTMKVTIK